jgi:hypothetical protein
MANEGVWDEITGLNDLNAEVVVSTAAPADPGALPTVETALTRNDATTEVRKVLENGHVYIVRNGVKYDVTGNKL